MSLLEDGDDARTGWFHWPLLSQAGSSNVLLNVRAGPTLVTRGSEARQVLGVRGEFRSESSASVSVSVPSPTERAMTTRLIQGTLGRTMDHFVPIGVI